MRFIGALIVCLGISTAATIDAFGQQTPPPSGPVAVPYGTPITLEQAKQVAAAAEAEARKNKLNVTIAIAEPSGAVIYLQKMDGAPYASLHTASDKATSSAMYRNPTKAFEDRLASGQNYILALKGAMPVEGGLPIVVDGKMIGAIGIGGGSTQSDGMVAKAGTDALR